MKQRKLLIIVLNSSFLYILVIVFSLTIGLWLLKEPSIWTSLPSLSFISGKKIIVDAGHGGSDPGAKSSAGILEKDINLDVALRLQKCFAQVGVSCLLIRDTDRDFNNSGPESNQTKKSRDLMERTRIVNQSGADIFLSIHANSFPQTIYRGAQTFYELKDPESKRLAKTVQDSFIKNLGPNKRKVRPGDFRMLKETKIPGITVEVGFLSNQEEAALLADPAYREKVAAAIFEGVVMFFSQEIAAPKVFIGH